MIVVDCSVLVAAVLDGGDLGRWVGDLLGAGEAVAPDHLLVEAHSTLRRLELAGTAEPIAVALARRAVLTLPVDLVPFVLVAERVWELRPAITAYDAASVAVAERLDAPLATLDARLRRAPGPRCRFLAP